MRAEEQRDIVHSLNKKSNVGKIVKQQASVLEKAQNIAKIPELGKIKDMKSSKLFQKFIKEQSQKSHRQEVIKKEPSLLKPKPEQTQVLAGENIEKLVEEKSAFIDHKRKFMRSPKKEPTMEAFKIQMANSEDSDLSPSPPPMPSFKKKKPSLDGETYPMAHMKSVSEPRTNPPPPDKK